MRRAWCLVALALDAAVSQQTSCPAGQGIDGVGPSGNCSHCPAGKQSSAGGIACTDCLESTRPSDDQAGCVCDATQTVSAEELQCDDGCRPGQECVSNATSGTASCTQCPEGKQSPDGVSPCSYCRFTMQPTRAQDGCVCAELHFNVWNSTSANVDLGCSPCSAVKVELAGGEESSCQTTGTMRACGKDESGRLEHPGVAGGRSRCDNSQAQCECSGGPKGESSLCARDGFWIKNRYDTDMDGTVNATEEAAKERLPEPVEDVDQAASVSLVQCVALRGKRSRCLHWSRCIGRTADVRWSDDDPYGEWNLDEDVQTTHVDEYGYHYVNDDRTQWGYTLMPDGDPPESGRDGPYHYIDDWEFSKWLNTSEGLDARCPHASNCCYPGFAGKLCDKCAQQTAADGTSVVPMKIGQSCVICEPGGINYGKLLSGLVMSFGFTLFIMRKASTTFQDADGTIAIAIFYFQIVALLFKDRAAEFGWFLVGLVSFMELGFLRNTEGTCVIKLSFYENFYFSIFSTLAVVSLSYGALIGLCILTSHETSKEEKMLQAEEAKCRKIVEHLLSHIPLFEGCTGEQMDVVASGMKLHFDLDKNHVIKKANDPKGVFVVVISGAIAVEHVTGRRGGGDLMGEYKSGHHYGEGALFAHGSKHIRIRAKKKHTTVMVLSKAKFMKLKAGDKLICEAVLDRVYEVQHSSDTALMEHGMTMHDLDSSGTLNITEAEAWLRARRFDPSQEFLRGLFKKFDADQNGEISQVEFKEVLREADALEDHFNHFDNDDSGTIDVDELAALMKACDSKLSKSEIDKLAKELDTNKSGDIDFDEFCEMMLERKLQIVRESLDNHYDPVLHAHIEGGEDALMGYR
jgi:Ca2+-binding EF-hand superfamily protein